MNIVCVIGGTNINKEGNNACVVEWCKSVHHQHMTCLYDTEKKLGTFRPDERSLGQHSWLWGAVPKYQSLDHGRGCHLSLHSALDVFLRSPGHCCPDRLISCWRWASNLPRTENILQKLVWVASKSSSCVLYFVQTYSHGCDPEQTEAIDKILSYMPEKKYRQTLLFSATIPPLVRQIADQALCTGIVSILFRGVQAWEHSPYKWLMLGFRQASLHSAENLVRASSGGEL
eukprot:5051205-Amphidinium_carterae.1